MLLTICSQPELRADLRKRAARYYPVIENQDQLIDRTISAVCDNPHLIETGSLQEALFKVMHHLAQPAAPHLDLSVDRAFVAA